nr:STAS domain-containing protein [uncultured Desulfobulbus sp.]
MEIRTEEKDGFVVVTIAGRIDALTSQDIEDHLMGLLDGGMQYIILDLADVPYLSSAGLRVLILLAKHLYGEGQLALCNLQETVEEIISMVGFKNYMLFFSTLAEAEANIFS